MPYFQELMNSGGAVMWLIFGCSVVAAVIVLERILYYHRAQIDVPEFLRGLFNVLGRNNVVEAVSICEETPGPVAHVVRAAILHADRDEAALRHAVQEAALMELPRLERRLKALATISHLAPMLGLLGTVLGMMGAFEAMQKAGAFVSTSDLAEHVRRALLTAAGGLTVAIPCYAFYNLLLARVESLTLDMDKAANEIIYFLTRNKVSLDGLALSRLPLGQRDGDEGAGDSETSL
jgi:biopolymer transport protein ExbB